MTIDKKDNICQRCVSEVSARQTPNSELLRHIVACPECSRMLSLVEQLRCEGSAYKDNPLNTALKLKIIQRVTPIIKELGKKSADSKTPEIFVSPFAWLKRWSLAFVLIGIIGSVFWGQINRKELGLPARFASVPGQAYHEFFTIALEGQQSRKISLDEPIALFAGEQGIVTLPDGSTLDITGPSRLTANIRGFHLINGYVKANIKKEKEKFVATTPHGTITVLGTTFICEVRQYLTQIEVISGKVKVNSDNGTEGVLVAGDEARMFFSRPKKDISFETETVPSLSKE